MIKTTFSSVFSCLLLCISLSGCMGNPPATRNKAQVVESMAEALAKKNSEIAQITAQKLHQWKEENRSFHLVDARSLMAFKMSHIPGARSLKKFLRNEHTNKPLIIYDTIGVKAIDFLQNQPHPSQEVYNLKGGLLSWLHQGYKLIDQQGKDSKEVYLESEAWNFLPNKYEAHTP